ncbi:MAG TPA: Hpt domain-containing protein [Clostridia bacterium]|nr:Hpt domain-containing protein [Clostridia bacterium]
MGNNVCRYDPEAFARELDVDLESISGLFREYFNEMRSEISEMNVFLETSDWNMLQRTVHNVKGVSANLNLNDVFEEAEKLDLQLKNGQVSESGIHVARIAELIAGAEKYIKEFFSEKGFPL